MGFINAVIDDAMDYGFTGGPRYSNELNDLENGFEYVDAAWLYPRHEYSADFTKLKKQARTEFIKMFHACRGRLHAFKMKDWNDYEAIDESLQVLPGTMEPVQLYKTYPFGEAYTIRPIQAVLSATIKTPGGATVAGTLDTETGMFTPAANWASGLHSWSGEFYVWVRFDSDYNSMAINSWEDHAASVELKERRRDITATNMPVSWGG